MIKSQLFKKQLQRVSKREERLHNKKLNPLIADRLNPALEQIQDKIPPKLKSTLDLAFYKGFQFVFEKANPIIEKTYNKERIQADYDINDFAIDSHGSQKHLRKMDQQSFQSKLWNESISFLEGSVLGILGIGLPDIPVFISIMLRTVQETALTYGYHFVTDEEKAYSLYIICGSLAKESLQREYSHKLDLLGSAIDTSSNTSINLDEIMKETAQLLSDNLLTIKFIQGLPIVGIVGGIVNPAIIHKIGKYASLKYKKRYLTRKIHNSNHLLN